MKGLLFSLFTLPVYSLIAHGMPDWDHYFGSARDFSWIDLSAEKVIASPRTNSVNFRPIVQEGEKPHFALINEDTDSSLFFSLPHTHPKASLKNRAEDPWMRLALSGLYLPRYESARSFDSSPLEEDSIRPHARINRISIKVQSLTTTSLPLENDSFNLFDYPIVKEKISFPHRLTSLTSLLSSLPDEVCIQEEPKENNSPTFSPHFLPVTLSLTERPAPLSIAIAPLHVSTSVALDDQDLVLPCSIAKEQTSFSFIQHFLSHKAEKALSDLTEIFPQETFEKDASLPALSIQPVSETLPAQNVQPSLTFERHQFEKTLFIASQEALLSFPCTERLSLPKQALPHQMVSQIPFVSLNALPPFTIDSKPYVSLETPSFEDQPVSLVEANSEDLRHSLTASLQNSHLPLDLQSDSIASIEVSLRSYNSMERHDRINKKYRCLSHTFLQFPTLDDLSTQSYTPHFDSYVEYAKDPQGQGYNFIIELTAPKDLTLPQESNHFIFLIDRSQAIEKHRYNVFKNAVIRSLDYIKEEDTVAVALFDTRIKFAFDYDQKATENIKEEMKHFLREEKHAPLHGTLDIYHFLSEINRLALNKSGMTHIILLTDGTVLGDLKSQREKIKKWMHETPSQLTLSIATCCNKSHFETIEMLSQLSRGEALLSPTNSAFGRKFSALVRRLSEPLLQDVYLTSISGDKKSGIQLSRDSLHFYKNAPLKIYGHSDTLDSFELFIQGAQKDHWINMRQTIRFDRALNVGKGLIPKIAKKSALPYYLGFIEEGDVAYLEKAAQIARPQK